MRIVFEAGQNFSAYLAARLIFVTVLLGVGLLFRPPAGDFLPYVALLVANSALSLGGWEFYRIKRFTKAVRWVTITLAVLIDTLVLHYVGQGETVFVFLYFFTVGASGLLLGWAGSAWTMLLCVFGINWLAQNHWGGLDVTDRSTLQLYGLNFALVAVLTSYFHTWFRQRELARDEALGELRQTKLDTQSILDSLETGVVVVNQERGILYSNPSGREMIALTSTPLEDSPEPVLPDDSPLCSIIDQGVIREDPHTLQEITVNSGARERIIGCSVSSLKSTSGELRGHLLLMTDLTPMKDAEKLERERERLAAIGMLSRDLAHEIRNPLATVRGCVEMLQDEPDHGEQQRFFQLALKESDRLNDLLRDFLTFAQIAQPKKQLTDLSAFVRSRLQRNIRGITYVDHLPDHLDAIIDRDQMALAVDALLLSLAEWSNGSGEIVIDAAHGSEVTMQFLLKVSTISTEVKAAVFQPFSNVNRSSHGLALPTAMRAVHAHGGELKLESRPGIGTWFELKL